MSVIVTIDDACGIFPSKKHAYCRKGLRFFFTKYGLDYQDFRFNGIDSDVLLKACNNDSMAIKVVEVASGRQK